MKRQGHPVINGGMYFAIRNPQARSPGTNFHRKTYEAAAVSTRLHRYTAARGTCNDLRMKFS